MSRLLGMMVLVPLVATVVVQASGLTGWGWWCVPQGLSYLCLVGWAVAFTSLNSPGGTVRALGLSGDRNTRAVLWGSLTGIGTGLINLTVIVKVTPWLGGSFAFLRETPHAQMPPFLMLSVVIPLIALLVELNFRGFILGRLLDLFRPVPAGRTLAIGLSALVFSFDPFMTGVFRVYHWLALSDGLVWGWLFSATGNLVTTVTAHAVEVMLVYTVLKFWYA